MRLRKHEAKGLEKNVSSNGCGGGRDFRVESGWIGVRLRDWEGLEFRVLFPIYVWDSEAIFLMVTERPA